MVTDNKSERTLPYKRYLFMDIVLVKSLIRIT